MKKLHLIITRAERTELAPELMDQLAKIEALHKQTRLFIENIRRAAQPNKQHRGTDRLVPTDASMNERMSLVGVFRESATGCFSDNPGVSAYMKQAGDVYEEINRHHDVCLRQVQLYCINALKKFTDQTYVQIKQAFEELRKKLTEYDYARDRLRKCNASDVEQRGLEAQAQQKNFEQQAMVLYNLLIRTPEHEMELSKAVNVLARAECEYFRTSYGALRRMKPPDMMKVEKGQTRPTTKSPDVKRTNLDVVSPPVTIKQQGADGITVIQPHGETTRQTNSGSVTATDTKKST